MRTLKGGRGKERDSWAARILNQSHMIDRIENRRAAEIFIERFGEDAMREAKIRAAELRAAGDTEGHKNWMAIHGEIESLLKETPGATTNR